MADLDSFREEIDKIDAEMQILFNKRMQCSKEIAKYKADNSLNIYDENRESNKILNSANCLNNDNLRPYYADFLKNTMRISRQFQLNELNCNTNNNLTVTDDCITVKSLHGKYNIYIKKGGINSAGNLFNLNRKVLIVTDSGIPKNYINCVKKQCNTVFVYTFTAGEQSKNLTTVRKIISFMLKNDFSRNDCIVAVGGGVTSDIAGYTASCYMRGIDFYNIPTTLLSQIDASIGSKTGVNFKNCKNTIGAFYSPKGIIIDSFLLKTLPKRHISNGIAEAVKIGLSLDSELFSIIKNDDFECCSDSIITRSILAKKHIVECDEREENLRRVLNFGHTIGHAIELSCNGLLHGECVAVGMLPFCSNQVRNELITVLNKYNIPNTAKINLKKAENALKHDKKTENTTINAVFVNKIGEFEFKKIDYCEALNKLKEIIE